MSSLTNPDLAPATAAQRTWSMWSLAALWIGMAVCIPTYTLAASMIEAGMSWWQAVLTVMLGNVIVLIPMILMGHAGTKYGIPFPVLARASFGTSGAHVPAIGRALVACGWFGIQTWIGGWAIYQVLGAMGAFDLASDTALMGGLGLTLMQLLCFLAFWALNLIIVVCGIDCIKWVEIWSAPFLLVMGLVLVVWAMVRVDDPAAVFAWGSRIDKAGRFWSVFFPQLTAMVCFWATLSLNIPDFTRYCRSQRDQALGQAIGLPLTMTLFAFIGVVVTAATVEIYGEAVWDPVALVARIGSGWVTVLALVALTVATLSTNIAANVVSPANGFSNLWPKRVGFTLGGLITCLIGVVIMPWRLYQDLGGYIFTWLIGYGVLLGPITGIMLCDYYVLRRTRLDAAALYDAGGPFAGVNWRAIVALCLAILPNLPGFINHATGRTVASGNGLFPEVFERVYTYAWFVGVILGALLYYALMRGRAAPAPAGAAWPLAPGEKP